MTKASGFGHLAIISVGGPRPDRFADFYGKSWLKTLTGGKGAVDDISTKLSSPPTLKELAALADQIAETYSYPKGTVRLAYFKTSAAETASLNAFLDLYRYRVDNDLMPNYSLFRSQDCANFTRAALTAAGVMDGENNRQFLLPNPEFWILSRLASITFWGGSGSRPDDK